MTVRDLVLVLNTDINPIIQRVDYINRQLVYEDISYKDSVDSEVINVKVENNDLIIII